MHARNIHDGLPQLMVRSVTAVVVAHNDAATLAATVERLHRALTVTVEQFQIAIYDDGSSDETPTAAASLAERLSDVTVERHEARRGPGACFRAAVAKATTSFVVYVPADNTWPYRSYVELIGNIGKADIITSSSGNLLASMPPFRRLVSMAYTAILSVIFRLGLDYYNGLTLYPRTFLRSIDLSSSGFAFQSELLIKALTAGYSYIQVALPVDDSTVVKSRAVNMENTHDALVTVLRLVRSIYFEEPAARPGSAADAPPARDTDAPPAAAQRVLVMGASSGIGEALARALAGSGHRVFAAARRADRLAKLAGEVGNVTPVPCDMTDEQQVARLVETIGADGGLDVLINCAGEFGEIGPITATDSARWWATFQTNVFGTYLTIKHCIPLLERGRKPRIINVSGGGAFSPFPNYTAYACSKAALVRLTESLAVELQPRDIRVNALSPGFLLTDIHNATLQAGEARAGRSQFGRTQSVLANGGHSLGNVISCVKAMMSPAFNRLTGKTISANFDPWETAVFQTYINEISASDLYTMRRVDVANLNGGYLRNALSKLWANFGSQT